MFKQVTALFTKNNPLEKIKKTALTLYIIKLSVIMKSKKDKNYGPWTSDS